MGKHKKADSRNNELIPFLINGRHNMSDAAKKFGISLERVRQILNETGNMANYKKMKLEIKKEVFNKNLDKCMLIYNECGYVPSRKELRSLTGVPLYYIDPCQKFMIRNMGLPENRNRIRHKQFKTKEQMLGYLKELSMRLGRTAGLRDILKGGKISHTTYYKHFGSIRKAQELAGLTPNQIGG